MLRTLQLRGYRSLRDFRLTLGRITVVTGGNGVGKSKGSGKRVWTFDG